MNTVGTIIRIIVLFMLLFIGWFCIVSGVYTLFIIALGVSFSWTYLWIICGLLVSLKIFYPRNVFA